MFGGDLAAVAQYALTAPRVEGADPVLSVQDLKVPAQIAGISFALHPGEIVGVAGMPNSGKESLSDALFGLVPRSGIVALDGLVVAPEDPGAAIAAGMALVPADRRRGGALIMMSVAHNIVSASLSRFSLAGLLRHGAIADTAEDYAAQLDVRTASLLQRIGTLSGGNQQKVILARGLVTKPKVLILHEPTRGIDVGAKSEIYEILVRLAAGGMGVLMISSELPEIVLHTSRVIVMEKGRIAASFTGAGITEEAILQAALGQPVAEAV